jgi:hypothetical protein
MHRLRHVQVVLLVLTPEALGAGTLANARTCPATAGGLFVYVPEEGAETEPPSDGAGIAREYDVVAAGVVGAEEVRGALSRHLPALVPPPFRPLVFVTPFGAGGRPLLHRLFVEHPGAFAVARVTVCEVLFITCVWLVAIHPFPPTAKAYLNSSSTIESVIQR